MHLGEQTRVTRTRQAPCTRRMNAVKRVRLVVGFWAETVHCGLQRAITRDQGFRRRSGVLSISRNESIRVFNVDQFENFHVGGRSDIAKPSAR
jgi:hypothetical protein